MFKIFLINYLNFNNLSFIEMSNTKGKNYDEYDWGSKKNEYYSRNKTNKDDHDFLEEEEEAKKIQMEKLKKLQEANLLDSDEESIQEKKVLKKISLYSSDEEDNKLKNNINGKEYNNYGLLKNANSDAKNKKGKKNLLNSGIKLPEKTFSSEELTEFSQILKNIKINVDDLAENVLPIQQVLESEDLKLEKTLNYFQLKKQAHLLYITYLNFYLYFKSLGKINDHHPVIKKMYFLKSIINLDKDYKDKVFEKIDKTLQLISEKKNFEDEENNLDDLDNEDMEDGEDDENDLELNENEEEEENEFNLDDEGSNDELNAEDILDLNSDNSEEDQNPKKKNVQKLKNKENKEDEKTLLKNKRNKPDSILDINFSNEKNQPKENFNKNENVNKFVMENMEKLKALKEKKEKLAEKADLKNQKEFEEKIDMGIRLANKNMLKARGIYRKRKQYQGNAKVHNREKYLKKQKLRKNMVKEYEGKPDVYIGETTGIRRDLIRSTKIK